MLPKSECLLQRQGVGGGAEEQETCHKNTDQECLQQLCLHQPGTGGIPVLLQGRAAQDSAASSVMKAPLSNRARTNRWYSQQQSQCQTLRWVKEALHRRLHTVRFDVCGVHSDTTNQWWESRKGQQLPLLEQERGHCNWKGKCLISYTDRAAQAYVFLSVYLYLYHSCIYLSKITSRIFNSCASTEYKFTLKVIKK